MKRPKPKREPRIIDIGVQADIGMDYDVEDTHQPCLNASTQVNYNELVQLEEHIGPIAEDLVHDVLKRSVFSLEQERDLQRISTLKQKYFSLRADEMEKLSLAKQSYVDISRQLTNQESALKKVLSIRMARELTRSLIPSVLDSLPAEKSESEIRLDQLKKQVIHELILDAYNVADTMNRVVALLATVRTPRNNTNHSNTCNY